MMKSVDKLREACKKDSYVDYTSVPHAICDAFGLGHHPYGWKSVLLPVCDAIEAEVEERYVPLPTGYDGNPIRPDETVYGSDGHKWLVTYIRVGRNHSVRATDGTESKALRPEWLTHCKPPTVEDVIDDLLARWMDCETPDQEEALKADVVSRLRLAEGGEG